MRMLSPERPTRLKRPHRSMTITSAWPITFTALEKIHAAISTTIASPIKPGIGFPRRGEYGILRHRRGRATVYKTRHWRAPSATFAHPEVATPPPRVETREARGQTRAVKQSRSASPTCANLVSELESHASSLDARHES